MYFVIEYVDTFTGTEGEALSWEFARTEDEARIKARAHLLLFKERYGAQGYRILSPQGSPVAFGPGLGEGARATVRRKNDDGFLKQEMQNFASCGSCASDPAGETLSKTSKRLNATDFMKKESVPDARAVTPQELLAAVHAAERHPGVSLSGKRVLVVEDEGLIALDLVCELERAGCVPVGPALKLETAMIIAAAQDLDAAVLDVLLDGAYAWQLAAALRAQGVPFLFQTAFGRVLDFPPDFATVPRLDKPVHTGALKRTLAAILGRPSQEQRQYA